MEKNWLDFGDLVFIFKVTGDQRLLKNALSALCLLNEWMNCNQPAKIYIWEMQKIWFNFGNFDSYFQAHKRSKKNDFSALYLLK